MAKVLFVLMFLFGILLLFLTVLVEQQFMVSAVCP